MDEPGRQPAYRGKAIELPAASRPGAHESAQAAPERAFRASLGLPPDDPDVLAGKPLHGQDLWPENLPGFRETVLDYHPTMTAGAALLCVGVRAPSRVAAMDYFTQFYRKPLIPVRLLPTLPQDTQAALEGGDSRPSRMAAASPYCNGTMSAGTEIKSKSGEWLIVPPVGTLRRQYRRQHALVDQQPLRLDPAPRRRHYGRERYSVGVFANPDYDTVIRPPTCVDAEHPPTFDQMPSGEPCCSLYSRVWPSRESRTKVSPTDPRGNSFLQGYLGSEIISAQQARFREL